MQRSFLRNVVFLSLIVRCRLPSIIQYRNIRFLHMMQCVIDIFYCCQKRCNDQCTLKTPWKKNCFIFLQIRSNSLAKKIYSTLWKQCNTSFNEFWPHYHFSTWQLFLTKGFHFFKENCHEDKIIPEIKSRFLQTYKIWTNTIHSWWN